MAVLFVVYITYCVVALYIPQSRQTLINHVLTVVRGILYLFKRASDPEFLIPAGGFIVGAIGVVFLVYLLVSGLNQWFYHALDEGGVFEVLLAGVVAILAALAGIVILVWGGIIAIGLIVFYYVGLPIVGLVFLAYLPAITLLLYKYYDYRVNPHAAELQFKQIRVEDKVHQKDVNAVRDAMLQSDTKGFSTGEDGFINIKNVLFGWFKTENRKEHLRRLREEMEEETASLNAFYEYVRAKNRAYGSDYDE